VEFAVHARTASCADAAVRLKQTPHMTDTGAPAQAEAPQLPELSGNPRLDPRLCAIALARAEQILPVELLRTPPPSRARLADLWGAGNGRDEALPRSIANALVSPLLQPLGTATSKIVESTPDADAAAHADLYWRCAIAVSLMAPAAVEGIARHHADLAAHLLPASAPADDRQRALVRAVLPRFAMVCTTAEEARAAEKRRAEIEAIKLERQQNEQREQREECERRARTGDAVASDVSDKGGAEEGVLL